MEGTKTMRTACGNTISYYTTSEGVNKVHSLTGPAFIYPESEGQAPEYYIYGVKYTKSKWQELINSYKLPAETSELETEGNFGDIY